MTLILSGTDGLSDVDGSAATPAIRGTDTNTGIFFPAADTIAFSEGGAEAMRIDSSGNVGVGTVSPTVSGVEISRATGSATPTPAELRISTTTNESGWSTTDPWGRLSFYSADASVGGAKVQASIQTTAAFTSGGSSNLDFFVTDSTNGTLFKMMSFQPAGTNNTQTLFYSGGGTERMRIDSSGNVGIGVTPKAWESSYKVLSIGFGSSIFGRTSTGEVTLSGNLYRNTAGTWKYINAGGGTLFIAGGDSIFTWYNVPTGGSADGNATLNEAMTLNSSGNLLVGTTSAGVSNSLSTTIETSGANTSRITVNHSSIAGSSNGSYFMQFGYGGTLSGGITQASTTTVGFYTGPSDRRLKNNIEDLDSSGEFIDALRPRKWTWIKSGEADSGFVADELQTVISCCVNGEADAVDEDGKPVYQMVDASPPEMIANIVAELKAIRKREKEQQALITSLTSRITELEAK